MSVFYHLLAVFVILCQKTAVFGSTWCQNDHERQSGFAIVNQIFDSPINTHISSANVASLLGGLLLRMKCDKQSPPKCDKCLSATKLFRLVNATAGQGLDEIKFNKASVHLLTFLHSYPQNCSLAKNPFVSCKPSEPECQLNVSSVQSLLEHINNTYRTGTLNRDEHGLITHETPYTDACNNVATKMFNGRSAMIEAAESNSDEGTTFPDLEKISGLIIGKILRGDCIVKLDQLPRPVDFTDAIFHMYGNRKTCTIQEKGFNDFMSVKSRAPINENTSTMKEHLDDYDINDVRKKCLGREKLEQIFGANISGIGISREEFDRMSPALLQQLLGNTCHEKITVTNKKVSKAEMYGYGSIIVLVISLGTLPGGFLAPFKDTNTYKYLLACMMGLAAGTLLGDGVLHLIPEAVGLDLTEATPPDKMHEIFIAPHKYKMFLVMAASYLFFVMELLFAWIGMKKKDNTKVIHVNALDGQDVTPEMNGNKSQYSGNSYELTGLVDQKGKAAATYEILVEKDEKPPSNISLAYMILIGDAIHNFADGLAIGAALHVGWKSGLSTSIAIICHEIPHELGDFAALLSVGWSYKKALLMNFLSGLTAFLGLYTGIAVSDNLHARQWIFALTAGMFLYIALSDLIPELLEYFKAYNPKYTFIAENLGFLLGFAIMVIITIFEDHIRV